MSKFFKKLLRFFVLSFIIIFFWPFLLCKKFGNTKIELTGNTVILANHYSNVDPLFLMLFFKKRIRFVTITAVKKKLLPRFITWVFDCFYLDKDSTNVSVLKEINQFLKDGGILGIFPEGAVNPRKYGFLEFQDGTAFIAKRAKANVVPIYLYPDYRPFKRSRMNIGAVIPFDEYAGFGDYTDMTTYFLSKVMDLSAAIDKEQSKEQSVIIK